MLARYTMKRGAPASALPPGVRQDTRKHTRHCLRPTEAMVTAFLSNPTDEAWVAFEREYRALLEERFRDDRTPFDQLVALARENDVYLGCSCPTKKNPDVFRCHTVLALRFMEEKYPDLDVVYPASE